MGADARRRRRMCCTNAFFHEHSVFQEWQVEGAGMGRLGEERQVQRTSTVR